jgi:DNA topoisomerase I
VAMAREIGIHPASGKPMSVRMGQYGAFVQIGTKDDEEKPKFAGLRPGQKMDTITMEQALELFKLPRTLGAMPDGEPIIANIGPFGPFLKYGQKKYVSLKEDDPYTVELPRALEVIRLKQEADANRIIADFGVESLQVLNGRFGPYVTNGKKNAKIPKDRDPKSITLEEARVMIEQAPERGFGRFGRGKKPNKAAAAKTNGEAAKADSATAAAKPAARKKKSAAPEKVAGAERAAGSEKAPASTKASAAAKASKSARPSKPPRPKGVAHIVRKGRSAVAKSHARKTAARAESTGKSTPKRARSGR